MCVCVCCRVALNAVYPARNIALCAIHVYNSGATDGESGATGSARGVRPRVHVTMVFYHGGGGVRERTYTKRCSAAVPLRIRGHQDFATIFSINYR